ncbi:glycosyltransferase involved in cell wall biosynthesis [Anseongella ginsenosidimutans]|uniref:Glycosyltransferase involved in cell wall biosynthesis n=1 Tax=Anseongella ginsenosidimutans TaxID=496056 RepID=A0A4R3KMX7_9SPHI|nr:glycosyltransferase [Anseongella ginsenosidimutans]QEC51993.1 glycosyltransferase [Anseongella ginsenosidimutans]TCS85710.1 glycosyltransferase involved in cell wall biosynthesis [Anseongella ginsenosidimutans]
MAKPLVSIAMCTYNGETHLKEQLDSILGQRYPSLEVVIVDDASTDGTMRILEAFRDQDSRIRLFRNDRNIGLHANFLKILSLCRGELIALSDQDDVWHPDKIAVLEQVIGDRLLIYHDSAYIDEKGKATGKTVHRLHRFVEGQRPERFLFQNCVSGHASMMRRELLSILPPFNDLIYYDWWLAYTAACTGKLGYTPKVLVEHRIHRESYTSRHPEDPAQQRIDMLKHFQDHPLTPPETAKFIRRLVKKYQASKGKSFSWPLFFTLLLNSGNLFYIRKRSLPSMLKQLVRECRFPFYRRSQKYPPSGKTLLIIDSNVPFHDRDSGSNRIYRLIQIFRSLGYHLIFLPDDGAAPEPYLTQLNSLGVEVLHQSAERKQFLREIKGAAREAGIAWICRPEHNAKYKYLFRHNSRLKWIYDTVDLHYIRLERASKLFPDQPKLAKQARRYRVLETAIAAKAQLTVCITHEEEQELQSKGIPNTCVIPNIHVIRPTPEDFHRRSGLLFIGSYKHLPNVDAATWLCHTIMPLVWKHRAEMELILLGSDPSDEVLACKSSRVHVPGYAEDVAPYFNAARIFVAPLRYGAGMKGKIGQSFEYGLPAVTTAIGAEGMGLIHEKHLLIAGDAEAFARETLRLYTDEALWKQLRMQSAEALKPFSPETISLTVQKALSSLLPSNESA